MLFVSAGSSNVDYRSLSWNRLITSVGVIEFHSNLVGDMCTMCAICPVNMSSIGGGLRFGGNSKVYKCSLSWNRLITSVGVIEFHSNLVGGMADAPRCCPVNMS